MAQAIAASQTASAMNRSAYQASGDVRLFKIGTFDSLRDSARMHELQSGAVFARGWREWLAVPGIRLAALHPSYMLDAKAGAGDEGGRW
jgi:hypothetical protein